jgi:hypothetical protein
MEKQINETTQICEHPSCSFSQLLWLASSLGVKHISHLISGWEMGPCYFLLVEDHRSTFKEIQLD